MSTATLPAKTSLISSKTGTKKVTVSLEDVKKEIRKYLLYNFSQDELSLNSLSAEETRDIVSTLYVALEGKRHPTRAEVRSRMNEAVRMKIASRVFPCDMALVGPERTGLVVMMQAFSPCPETWRSAVRDVMLERQMAVQA